MLECCWGLAEGACGFFSLPLVEILGGWKDIIDNLDGEACPECLHLPQLFPSPILLSREPVGSLVFERPGDHYVSGQTVLLSVLFFFFTFTFFDNFFY